MRLPLFLLVQCAATSLALSKPDYDKYDYYAVHISPETSPAAVAAHLGLDLDGSLGALEDHYVLRAPKADHDLIHQAKQKGAYRERVLAWYRHDCDRG